MGSFVNATNVNAFGVVLEVLGLAVAAWGAWQTWRDNAPDGEAIAQPIIAPMKRWLLAFREWLAVSVNRLLGRPVTVRREWQDSISMKGTLTHKVITPPFPALATDPQEAIAALDERTRQLLERLTVLRDGNQTSFETLRSDMEEADARLSAEIEATKMKGQSIAIGGIRVNMAGFLIVAIGLALQLVAPLFPA